MKLRRLILGVMMFFMVAGPSVQSYALTDQAKQELIYNYAKVGSRESGIIRRFGKPDVVFSEKRGGVQHFVAKHIRYDDGNTYVLIYIANGVIRGVSRGIIEDIGN